MILVAETAEELMTPNPISIRDLATVREAITLLTDKGISAVPVIDKAGRPVGVLSRSDIVVHDRETVESLSPVSENYDSSERTFDSGQRSRPGLQGQKSESTVVRDLMTPIVFSAAPEASAQRVVEDMVALKVHRLFVVDRSGVLVGVITALDVLRHLAPWATQVATAEA
jgi:CBS domain-containing protein